LSGKLDGERLSLGGGSLSNNKLRNEIASVQEELRRKRVRETKDTGKHEESGALGTGVQRN